MCRYGAQVRPRLLQPPLQLHREEQVRKLRLAVRPPALITALLPVEVVEVEAARRPVRARRDRHHPIRDLREQQVGERKRAEVVRADLHLEAVLRAALGHGHDTGVVHENVDRAMPRRGELAHRGQVREVELPHLRGAVDRGGRLVALVPVAHGQHHARARTRELACGRQTDATVGAGHDERAAVEPGHVAGGPLRRHEVHCSPVPNSPFNEGRTVCAVQFLRRISTARLLALCAAALVVIVGGTALALAATSGGPVPPKKPLANAVHDAITAPELQGVTARISFKNNLLSGVDLRGSNPILAGADGRLWATNDGHFRLELQSNGGGGDAQIVSDGKSFWLYDGSSNTVYRGTVPQDRHHRTTAKE